MSAVKCSDVTSTRVNSASGRIDYGTPQIRGIWNYITRSTTPVAGKMLRRT
jgi:hypothetical protein